MLAQQPLDRGQPFFELLERPGGAPAGELAAPVRGVLAVAGELIAELPRLQRQRPQPLGQRIELRVDALDRCQRAARLRHQLGGARTVVAAAGRPARGVLAQQPTACGTGRRQQRVERPQPLPRGEHSLVLLRVGRELVDLRDLELEQLELPVALGARGLELLEPALELAHAPVGVRTRSQATGLLGTAAAVEDRQLGARQRQAAVLVLRVEPQQRAPERAQVGHRRRAAVDQGARAPVAAHAPGEHHLALILSGAQQLQERLVDAPGESRGQLEHALDVGLLRTRPHDSRPRATAQEQVEGVGEDRLAGPGLPREDVETRRQAQVGPLDQQEILHA